MARMAHAIGQHSQTFTGRKQERWYQIWIQYQITLWLIRDMLSDMLTH